MNDLGAEAIRIGAAINRAEAHLAASSELYGSGRKPDALLQAARPATDILPWLEVELRGADAELREFFTATSLIGAAIRRNEKPRAVRKAMGRVERAGRALLVAALGPVAEDSAPPFGASVAVALLEEVPNHYRRAVEQEQLGEYQTAYALANWATDLLFHAYDGRNPRLNDLVKSVTVALPAAEPPDKLVQPDDVENLVDRLAEAAIEELDAVRITWTLNDSVKRLERLLGDVVDAYEKGLGPLAARLAASLFILGYDPLRQDIAGSDPDAEARLTSLLGFELRRAINESAPADAVRTLEAEVRTVLATLRTNAVTERDSSPGRG